MNEYNLHMGKDGYEEFRSAFLEQYKMFRTMPLTPEESVENNNEEIMENKGLDIDITSYNNSYGNSRMYRYIINGETLLKFDQIPYPECCGIAIIKNFSVDKNIDRSDFIKAIDDFCEDIMNNDRFSKVLFYTNSNNIESKLFSIYPEIVILDSFENRRSGNMLIGFEINLLDKKSDHVNANNAWQTDEFLSQFDQERLQKFRSTLAEGGGRPINYGTGGGIANQLGWSEPDIYGWATYISPGTQTPVNMSTEIDPEF